MDYKPMVSIIIPVYNGAEYVAHAIDCALAQTYQNIEIIIINDGSTDNNATDAVVRKYNSPKIHYYVKQNGGVSSALNYAINNMQGEWFSWLSHDDGYYPQKVERQLEIINQLSNQEHISPENYVIYGSNEIIDSKGKVILRKKHSINNNSTTIDLILDNIIDYKICGCAVLVHKKHLLDIGGFNESIRTISDAECFYRLILQGLRFYYLDEVLVQSRQHKRQVGKQKAQLFQNEGDEFHLWVLDQILLHNEWKKPEYYFRYLAGVTKRGYLKSQKAAKEAIINTFGAKFKTKILLIEYQYRIIGKFRSLLRLFYRRIFVK